MLSILFNKSTLFFYLLVLISQVLTRSGLFELKKNGKTSFISISNALNLVSLFYVFYYSYKTNWWAFIGLVNVAVILCSIQGFFFINRLSYPSLETFKSHLLVKLIPISIVFLMFFFLTD